MTNDTVDIGDGVKEKTPKAEEPVLVDGSTPSTPKEKRRTTRTEKPITKEEAVELFQSALNYLKGAGFTVKAINEDAAMILFVENLKYEVGQVSMLP